MDRRRPLPFVLLLTAAFLLPAHAQERPSLPDWQPSLEAAAAVAKERGQAVMVALNMDSERGNQQMLDEVYTSEEVRAAAGQCVPVIASMFEHGLVTDPKSGKRVCARFGAVTCEQHRAIGELAPADDAKARKLLHKAVGNGKDPARAHAVVALHAWARDEDVKDALSKILLQGGDQKLRSAACWTLGYSEDKAILADLKKFEESLSRRDWRVRRAAEAAIDKLRGRSSPQYDNGPALFLPHPAEDDGKEEEEPWKR